MDLIPTHPKADNPTRPETATAGKNILPLRVNGLNFVAGGTRLIHDVSFQLAAGPRTIILGPNGAGKSLLLRLCHGLLAPNAGTIQWSSDGKADPQQQQAMVFQRPVLLRRSVRANVDFALKMRGIAKMDRGEIIESVLNRTGLARFQDHPARKLSGGEQQKLALARAWATKPQVLFLDEPTASLDPAATYAVEEIVTSMHDEGTRIIMTTHDLGQARRLADEVLFIHKGHLMEHTPAPAFFDAPESGEAAAFLKGELRW